MVRKITNPDFSGGIRFIRVIKNFASRNFLLLNYLFGIVFIGRVRWGGTRKGSGCSLFLAPVRLDVVKIQPDWVKIQPDWGQNPA